MLTEFPALKATSNPKMNRDYGALLRPVLLTPEEVQQVSGGMVRPKDPPPIIPPSTGPIIPPSPGPVPDPTILSKGIHG
jgi:hypothetical protein